MQVQRSKARLVPPCSGGHMRETRNKNREEAAKCKRRQRQQEAPAGAPLPLFAAGRAVSLAR